MSDLSQKSGVKFLTHVKQKHDEQVKLILKSIAEILPETTWRIKLIALNNMLNLLIIICKTVMQINLK